MFREYAAKFRSVHLNLSNPFATQFTSVDVHKYA